MASIADHCMTRSRGPCQGFRRWEEKHGALGELPPSCSSVESACLQVPPASSGCLLHGESAFRFGVSDEGTYPVPAPGQAKANGGFR